MEDQISQFLQAVDDLRADDTAVRTTAHTSSVSADGWPTSDPEISAASSSDES
ncbi:hypothetical protein [Actinomadura rupiterrae]|uniref:hypothetical protein n=1 Tax=Actinomadura rupiterrae TaxID=559627 RepID=UPI0020A4E60F|nr:hypothetical protein [Actinomadura rupiterrae]MCP2337543.1 hypothetical protein [Actinomadura rupiterrae]